MGISGIWDVLGRGRVCHIAEYVTQHYERYKRPLRIAVDEACWRFTNLTPDQVTRIRDGEPAANPVEKTILWRILRLWRLDVQLIFVYDGLRKPGKSRNTGGGGKVDKAVIKLLHQMFDHLGIAYHQAPGEAEAECARLQNLGIVDVVWSDDSDSLMFGCKTLIRQHKENSKPVTDHIRVYESSDIAEGLALDAHSLVLFALLSGGDYNTQGLKNCGPQTARLVAKREYGVAKELNHISQQEVPQWRQRLQQAFTLCGSGKSIEVPSNFPDWKVLNGYRSPAVSTDAQLQNLRCLRAGWEPVVDQDKLRIELRRRYNFTTREYLKHIAPVFLTRSLARSQSTEQRTRNLQFEIKLKPRRARKIDSEEPTHFESRILFCPVRAVEIDLSTRPLEEDWAKFASKDGTPYDPSQLVECEVLQCFLDVGLPSGSLKVAVAKRKGKSDALRDPSEKVVDSIAPTRAVTPNKRGRPVDDVMRDATSGSKPSKKRQKQRKSPDEVLGSPPPPKFIRRELSAFITQSPATFVDLDSEVEIAPDEESSHPSLQSTASSLVVDPPSPFTKNGEAKQRPSPSPNSRPDHTIGLQTLRELRMTALSRRCGTLSTARYTPSATLKPTASVVVSSPEIIDLT